MPIVSKESMIKNFASNFFIQPGIYGWSSFLVLMILLFFGSGNEKQITMAEVAALTIIFSVLFFWGLFYLIFKTYTKQQLENKMVYVVKHSRDDAFVEEFDYFVDLDCSRGKKKFLHVVKSKKEFANEVFGGVRFSVLINLMLLQLCAYYWQPFGPILYLIIILIAIYYSVSFILWAKEYTKNSGVPILFGIFTFLLLWSAKFTFSRSFGNPTIDSFVEKLDYKTYYYVNVFVDQEETEILRVPGEIVVEQKDKNSFFILNERKRYLNRIFLPDREEIRFFRQDINLGERTEVEDRNRRPWVIELTNIKCKKPEALESN
jgi:hypothetical protein